MTKEEAIKIIESNCSCSGSKLREACAMFIPELAESEDERIRKGLIHHLKELKEWKVGTMSPIKVKEHYDVWIAFLEKQKEPSMSATEVLIKAGLKPYKDGNQWCILAGDNIQEGICGFGDTIDEALYQFLIEVLEKQKESLHISETCKENADSFTDEDERIRKQLVDIVAFIPEANFISASREDCRTYLKRQKVNTDGDFARGYDCGYECCLNSHGAEWFEKQKEQNVVPSRETILGIWELGNLWKENPEERDGLTQLQYIQKYWFEKCDYLKEQKPTDEDEKIIQELIDYLNPDIPFKTVDIDTVNKWVAWLKKQKEPIDPFDTKLFQDGVKEGRRLEREDIKKERKSAENDGKELLYVSNKSYKIGYRDGKRDAEQKPAEWSEEDEKIMQTMIKDGDLKPSEIAWLKSLRPQPKQEDRYAEGYRQGILLKFISI